MTQQRNGIRTAALFAVLVGFAIDALVCMVMFSDFYQLVGDQLQAIGWAAGIGLLTGQAVLVAVWSTLGAQPLSIRLPVSAALVLLVLYSCFLGTRLTDWVLVLELSLLVAVFCMVLFLFVCATWLLHGAHLSSSGV